jgi:hypothetical protein
MKKNLKILSIILATILCLAFSTTAFAATIEDTNANSEEIGFSQEELENTIKTGKPIQKIVEDGEATYILEVAPSKIVPKDGYVNYGQWYDFSVSVYYSGELCGVAIQPIFIGYTSHYYFGSMGTLRYTVYNGWAAYSVTSGGGGGSVSMWVRAFFSKGSTVTGAKYRWNIDIFTGYVTSTRVE